MFSPTKPSKGRKLDAILLKISESSKSDIGNEKHGISPENLSVQDTFVEDDFDKPDVKENSLDGTFDLAKRRKSTRKGDARRIMRLNDGDTGEDGELEDEEQVRTDDIEKHGQEISSHDGDVQKQNGISVTNLKGFKSDTQYSDDNSIKLNGHHIENTGEIEFKDELDSAVAEEDELAVHSLSNGGVVNSIGERLSLLDAYLYHGSSDEDDSGETCKKREKKVSMKRQLSREDESPQGPVTVVPIEPRHLELKSDNDRSKLERAKGAPQPPTCNICGKSFSCISNVYRHKRKVHRKKGGKVYSHVSSQISPATFTSTKNMAQSGQSVTNEKKESKLAVHAAALSAQHLGREINCELCGKTLTKSNIARHRRLVHFNPNRRQPVKQTLHCDKKEGKIVQENKDITEHKSRKEIKENKEPPPREPMHPVKVSSIGTTKKVKFSCDICQQVFSCRSNVYRHKRLVHKKSPRESTQVNKLQCIKSAHKVIDKVLKKEPENEKKTEIKKEKSGTVKHEPENMKFETSIPLDTPANSMVSLPTYRRSKFVCGLCGLVFMARSTYYRHKKSHRTGNNQVKPKGKDPIESKTSSIKPDGESEKVTTREDKKKSPETNSVEGRAAANSEDGVTVITSGRGKSKFACGLCGQVFPCRSNAYHHRRLAHGKYSPSGKEAKPSESLQHQGGSPTSDSLRWSRRPGSCDICGKIFSCKGNIYRHKRLVHGVEGGSRSMFRPESPEPEPVSLPSPAPSGDKCESGKYLCDICGNGFSCAGNVQRHKRNVHGLTPQREAYMSNSRAKQLLAKAKSYTTRRAAAVGGHSHELRSSSLLQKSFGRNRHRAFINQNRASPVKSAEEGNNVGLQTEDLKTNSEVEIAAVEGDKKDMEVEGSEPASDKGTAQCSSEEVNFGETEDPGHRAVENVEKSRSNDTECISDDQIEDIVLVESDTTQDTQFKMSPVKETLPCPHCKEVFLDANDFEQHVETHKIRNEKVENNAIQVGCTAQQIVHKKQLHNAKHRYHPHTFSPNPGYYPCHPYSNHHYYAPCAGYCDRGCHQPHIKTASASDHEGQYLYYPGAQFFGSPHPEGQPHFQEQVYHVTTSGAYDDRNPHFGHRHGEVHFHEQYGRRHHRYSKHFSPDIRPCERQILYDVGNEDEQLNKDQLVVQQIIDAHLEEESNISDIYTCLSCSKTFSTRSELDGHSEVHASEGITELLDMSQSEFLLTQTPRPSFHYPQPAFFNPAIETFAPTGGYHIPPTGQQPPLVVGSGTVGSVRQIHQQRPDSNYFLIPPGSCPRPFFKGSATEIDDLEENKEEVIICCMCGDKYTTKTDLWSHLMRRHGLKSKDARTAVHECLRQGTNVACDDVNRGIDLHEATVLHDSPRIPVVADNGLDHYKPTDSENITVDPTTNQTCASLAEEPLQMERGCTIPENSDVCVQMSLEIPEEFESQTYCSALPCDTEEISDNPKDGEPEVSLFNSVCENVMALINSPDGRMESESDFVLNGSGENSCTGSQTSSHVCRICSRSFHSGKSLGVHLRLHRGELPFKCNLCLRRFRNMIVLKQHRGTHADLTKQVLHCKICDKDFGKITNYVAHVRYHEDKHTTECKVCGRFFVDRSALQRHKLSHRTDNNKLICSFCCGGFKSFHLLRVHLSKKHKGSKYCSHCSRSFKDSVSLKVHTKRHLAQRSITCEQCMKTFENRVDLRDHISGEHECSCAVCKRSFESLNILERHKLFVHKIKSRRARTWHVLTLKKLRPVDNLKSIRQNGMKAVFSCRVCAKSYSSKSKLGKHVSLHNGILAS